jgi:hypothetical protein
VSKRNGRVIQNRKHPDDLTGQKYIDSVIKTCEWSHKNGNPKAWWDIVVFCEQNNLPKPLWVRDLLLEHALEKGKPASTKRQQGRPSDHSTDIHIYISVEYWREERYRNNRYPRGRNFSLDQAFEKVRNELSEERGLSLTSEGVAKAYYRGKGLIHSEHLRHAGAGPVSARFYGT